MYIIIIFVRACLLATKDALFAAVTNFVLIHTHSYHRHRHHDQTRESARMREREKKRDRITISRRRSLVLVAVVVVVCIVASVCLNMVGVSKHPIKQQLIWVADDRLSSSNVLHSFCCSCCCVHCRRRRHRCLSFGDRLRRQARQPFEFRFTQSTSEIPCLCVRVWFVCLDYIDMLL